MNFHCHIIIVGLITLNAVLASAESLDTVLADCQSLSPQEKIGRLEKAIAASSEQDREVFQLLLTDAKYEAAKRQTASRMLALATSRATISDVVGRTPFAGQAAQYEALGILQSIPLAWLTGEEREQALSFSVQIESNLRSAPSSGGDDSPSVQQNTNSDIAINNAMVMVNESLEQANHEDLSLISSAITNGRIRDALAMCDKARQILMEQSPDQANSSRTSWETAMLRLSQAVSVLKQRQALKYALWAEGLYRDSDPTNISHKLGDEAAMALYRRLSKINVSLVAEPSLAREITKRLYELYDSMDSQRSKERVRYDSIITLDKRVTLDDF